MEGEGSCKENTNSLLRRHASTQSLWAKQRTPADIEIPKFRRVTSTPDPDTFEKYRDTPPISILAKVCPPLGRKYYIHHQFVSRYASHLYRDAFSKVLGSGVVGALPKNIKKWNWQTRCFADRAVVSLALHHMHVLEKQILRVSWELRSLRHSLVWPSQSSVCPSLFLGPSVSARPRRVPAVVIQGIAGPSSLPSRSHPAMRACSYKLWQGL